MTGKHKTESKKPGKLKASLHPSPPADMRRSTAGGSASDRIADTIVKDILARRRLVGQRLIEADLMNDFEVGRSTVREALKVLAASGVVELVHNRGAVIRALSASDAQELLQVLEMLCGLAARLAAEKIDEGRNRQRFEAATCALLGGDETTVLASVLDQRARYYQVMFDIAANRELNRIMPLPRIHLFRTQFYAFLSRNDVREMANEYRGISEAILAGDTARAEARMRRHLQKTAERTVPLASEAGNLKKG